MKNLGIVGKLFQSFIDSKLTPLIILISIAMGMISIIILPREEEPQIIVPMADVFVDMPGASVKEVENRVTKPLEALINEIPGVEYIYSITQPTQALVIVRFKVGENLEASLVRLYNKLYSNFDKIPDGASKPLIKPKSIDDVPILALTLLGSSYTDIELRDIANQLKYEILPVKGVSQVELIGSGNQDVKIILDIDQITKQGLGLNQVIASLKDTNTQFYAQGVRAGKNNISVSVKSGFNTITSLGTTLVAVKNNKPVYLNDIARIERGNNNATDKVFYAEKNQQFTPAITLSIAKKPGTNAIDVVNNIIHKLEKTRASYIPQDVTLKITRNYGETAAERSNELLVHMGIAVFSVTLLIAWALGRKESLIVAISIPVTLALTLFMFNYLGFTLNRVTFFALIFSIGILVDDAIVVVENIVRHIHIPENRPLSFNEIIIKAVDEVGNPTILATIAVIAAILPMAFVGGLMGPYMRPIPLGASFAMLFSLLTAFIVIPWITKRILNYEALKKEHTLHSGHDPITEKYQAFMSKLIYRPKTRNLFILIISCLLLGVMAFIPLKLMLIKMLPYDNKNEVQVIMNFDKALNAEFITPYVQEVSAKILEVPEVMNLQSYINTAAPFNFNGLVRHYFLRYSQNDADIQVNLLPKNARNRQSHAIAQDIRLRLQNLHLPPFIKFQVAEVPPGPPVMQTIVAEVYGKSPERRAQIAQEVFKAFKTTQGIVDADYLMDNTQQQFNISLNTEIMNRLGINKQDVLKTLTTAMTGLPLGLLHHTNAGEDINLLLTVNNTLASDKTQLANIPFMVNQYLTTVLGAFATITETQEEPFIYHKNLLPLTYITADVSGAIESPVYGMLDLDKKLNKIHLHNQPILKTWGTWPQDKDQSGIKWDGEWQITFEVFRDLGFAFLIVLFAIYLLLVGWFKSFVTPVVIMLAIPFSLVGIIPAHALSGAYFTATSMIGFIAGAGIVVRNSIILVDFIQLRIQQGMNLEDAVIEAGVVRFRPMMLTALAVMAGSAVILMDPIFQGLAISLMAGELASLLLSRTAVPVFYYLTHKSTRALKPHDKSIL